MTLEQARVLHVRGLLWKALKHEEHVVFVVIKPRVSEPLPLPVASPVLSASKVEAPKEPRRRRRVRDLPVAA
jgi:hypothetical protein